MKILFVTDIHDALKELRVLLSSTEADLYLLCGDILYHAFYDEDKIYQFVCLQEEFYSEAKQLDRKIMPYDLATEMLRYPERFKNDTEEWNLKAAEYRMLFHKAGKTMKEKYELIEELIEKYSNASCFMLPGNYDIDLRYTRLVHRDLHHKEVDLNGLKFAGYGGAPIATSGIPEKLAITYHESRENGNLYSEPEEFFEHCHPDVMVLHNPAYGFFDRVPTIGHVGSPGIRNYLDRQSASLVASGHVHEDYGIARKKDGTILLNPSNFGGVDSPYGWQPGGIFAEITLNGRQFEKLVLRGLDGNQIYDFLEVTVQGEELKARALKDLEKSHLDLSGFVRDHAGQPVELFS